MIELNTFSKNEEKLHQISDYLEQLKHALVEISADYGEEQEDVSDLLGDALETMDDLIDSVNETADEIAELDEE